MFDTTLFWIAVFVIAALARAISPENVRTKSWLFAFAGLAIGWHIIGLSPWILALIVAAAVWIVLGIRLTQRWHATTPILSALAVVGPLIAMWSLGKVGVAAGRAHLELLAFVGFSFFLVKAWTLVRDAQDGRIANLDLSIVLAYFLFFPTYVAGPMHLYGEFETTLAKPEPVTGESALDIAYRIALGLVKVKVAVPMLAPITLTTFTAAPFPSRAIWLVACVAYYLMLWCDFSGYCDLAIATSSLMGVRTPENFRTPFIAANIRDFWQRWHITFSRVLTSYLFVPISRRIDQKLGRRVGKKTTMIVATLGTFLFCGYWHGATLNFVLWGLYHAIGLIVFDLYRDFAMQRRRKKKDKTPPSPLQTRVENLAAMALTFVFVSIGWTFFVLPIDRLIGRH